MILYIYWMAFFLATYVAWDEIWWLRILCLIVAGVFLFLANRKYAEQQMQIDSMKFIIAMMIEDYEKNRQKDKIANRLQSKYMKKMWKRVVELERQKVSDDDAE